MAVKSSHMGLGLGKVLLSAALQHLRRHHSSCYLTTQTTSARAIGMYFQFGFVPLLTTSVLKELDRTVDEEVAAWRSIAHLLPAGALKSVLPSL